MAEDVADRAALAGGVHPLEHHEHTVAVLGEQASLEVGERMLLLNLLGGARKRWTSLDADDRLSVAATLDPSPMGTPARKMRGGRGSARGASTWDSGMPGSFDASSVEALLLLIEMHGAPQPEAAPTAAPANCRLPRGQREDEEDREPEAARVAARVERVERTHRRQDHG